ncbi:MAG: MotA/TolQ/ExbB proton channel family protein [Opitutales bacterium]
MKKLKNTPNSLNLLLLLLSLCAGLCCASIVSAQSADAPAETEAAAQSSTNLLTMLGAGGWAMYPLGFLSISAFALTVYNFIALRPKDFFDPEAAEELGQRLTELDIEGAKSFCLENPTPLMRIAGHGLDSTRDGQVDLELFKQRLEAGTTKELAQPFVIINYLSIIASIAPMLGLLGTVSGMVKAFNSIATVGMGQPDLLAGNISEALITTATGMIIGIPTMFFFFYFKNHYGKLVSETTMYLEDIYSDLVHGLRVNSSSAGVQVVSASNPAPSAPEHPESQS